MGLIRRIGTCPMIMLTALAAGAVLAAPPAAASGGTAPGWPQFSGNAAHTGDEAAETSVNRQNVAQLSVAWTKGVGSPYSEVAVSGGTVYVNAGQTVTALAASSGTTLWQQPLPGTLNGTPAVQGSLVLVDYNTRSGGRTRGYVAALDSSTGAVAWATKVSAEKSRLGLLNDVTTTTRRAYVITPAHTVAALSLASGRVVWTSAVVPGCLFSDPSVSGSLVVVGGGGGYVTALHASDGTTAWTDTLGGGCGGSAENWLPAISGGTVYAGLLGGTAALDLATGTVRWENTTVKDAFFPLSLARGDVIVGFGPRTTRLGAVSQAAGALVWNDHFGGLVASASTFGHLAWALVMGRDSSTATAVALDAATGGRVYTSSPFGDPESQLFPPVVAAGHVYINTGSELICLALPAAG